MTADVLTPADIAKGALRRLALARLEPTPENYARAWAEERGEAAPPAAAVLPDRARPLLDKLAARVSDDAAVREQVAGALMRGQWDVLQQALDTAAQVASARDADWLKLVQRLARGLDRGSRQWTAGRKKDSLQRVLDAARGDPSRLPQRLRQMLAGWESDSTTDEPIDTGFQDDVAPKVSGSMPLLVDVGPRVSGHVPLDLAAPPASASGAVAADWTSLVAHLGDAVRAALPADEPRAQEVADTLATLADRIAREGASVAVVAAVAAACERARRLWSQRHHLVE
jgi:diguanylate cyclase